MTTSKPDSGGRYVRTSRDAKPERVDEAKSSQQSGAPKPAASVTPAEPAAPKKGK